MKLAVETYIPVKVLGLEKGLRAISNAGFDGVDFTFYFELEQFLLGDDYLQIARKARKIMDELGITCRQSHAPFGLSENEAFDESEPHFRNIIRSMEASAVLGSKVIVVHAVGDASDAGTEHSIQSNLRLYQALLPYCKKCQIQIGVENLGNALTCAEQHNRLMSRLDQDWFVTCLDVGHVKMKQMEPQDFIRNLLPGRLKALHVHDNDGTDDQHQLMYLGGIDWNAVLEALKETGYEGDLTLESWRFLDCFPVDLLQSALSFEENVGRSLIQKYEQLHKA